MVFYLRHRKKHIVKVSHESKFDISDGDRTVATASTTLSSQDFSVDGSNDTRLVQVRFSHSIEVHRIPAIESRDVKELWYTLSAREEARHKARSAVKMARYTNIDYINAMHAAHRTAGYLAATLTEEGVQEFLNDSAALAEHGRELNRVMNIGMNESLRGLEQIFSDACTEMLDEQIQEARKMVVHMSKHKGWGRSEDTAHEYGEMSRKSIILSRMFAAADVHMNTL